MRRYRFTWPDTQRARKALIAAYPNLGNNWALIDAWWNSRCVACVHPVKVGSRFLHNGNGNSCHLACAYRIAGIDPIDDGSECVEDA